MSNTVNVDNVTVVIRRAPPEPGSPATVKIKATAEFSDSEGTTPTLKQTRTVEVNDTIAWDPARTCGQLWNLILAALKTEVGDES